jgi:hypothetical protein
MARFHLLAVPLLLSLGGLLASPLARADTGPDANSATRWSGSASVVEDPSPRGSRPAGKEARASGSTAAVAAPAGGIVFIYRNNIWIASPDGKTRRQVRFDGTASSPWRDPSMTDNGTIVAFRNSSFLVGSKTNQRGTIYRLNQAGRTLSSFRPPQQDSSQPRVIQGFGLSSVTVSPNGAAIAWQNFWLCSDPVGPQRLCYFTDVARSDGTDFFTIGRRADMSFMADASWTRDGTNTLLLSHGGNGISFYRYRTDLRGQRPPNWFGYDDLDYQGDPSARGNKLALVGRFDAGNVWVDAMQLLLTNGAPPAEPTSACYFQDPAGSYRDPSWGPGDFLAWTETDANTSSPEPAGEGLWVGKIVFAADSCTFTPVNGRPTPVVADAESADFGAHYWAAARRGVVASDLQYSAGGGTTNSVAITARDAKNFSIQDLTGAAIDPGSGCSRLTAARVSCPRSGVRRLGVEGNDRANRLVVSVAVPAVISGGAGNDRILGGSRGDRINPGAGSDSVSAGAGDDVVSSRDGQKDSVDCGAGRDKLTADKVDVAIGCESVSR